MALGVAEVVDPWHEARPTATIMDAALKQTKPGTFTRLDEAYISLVIRTIGAFYIMVAAGAPDPDPKAFRVERVPEALIVNGPAAANLQEGP